jgi:methylmalonyl-CoA/ethylmalonyl-CoA epimerase
MPPRLHHTGYVVASIQEAAPRFQQALGLDWDGEIIHDPLQMSDVAFLPSRSATDSVIELVEPSGRRSPVREFAESGGGLHHVCYEVPDLDAAIRRAEEAGHTLVRFPLPAAAFGGRKIAWVRTDFGLLIEFLQSAL